MGEDLDETKDLLKELSREFEFKSEIEPNKFLGIEIERTKQGTILTQNYTQKVLELYAKFKGNKYTDTDE